MNLDLRNRSPIVDRLPDQRLRVTRIYDVLNNIPKTPEELLELVWLDWGTTDVEFTNCRLIAQTVSGQPKEFPDTSKLSPTLTRVYEEISETAETSVGNADVSINQYGYQEVTQNWIQFSGGIPVYQVPGTTPAAAPFANCILRNQDATDDGTLRRIKRVYVQGGVLSDVEELKFGGRLLIRTIKTLGIEPPAPAGFTLVTQSIEYINGERVYAYGYAEAVPTPVGVSGGVISRKVDYNLSPDQGATGVTVTTIRFVSNLSTATNPIVGPVGAQLISSTREDSDGYTLWTSIYASGTGIVTSSKDIREGGKLILYSITSINAAPSTPAATIGGTVTLTQQNQRNGTDAADGTIIYDYQWAEGLGEVSRGFTNSNGGPVDFNPANPIASIGPIICTIRYISALTVTTDPTTRPASFVRIGVDREDREGYRAWTVRYGYGAGMIEDDVEYKNQGRLKIYHRTALGAAPDAPEPTESGSVSAINVVNGGSGYTTPPTVIITGGGGTGAVASAVLSGTSIASISLVGIGAGYTSPPVISIVGGGGTGAVAAATLTPTGVGSLALTNGGSGYTSVPTVALVGGGGTGATATAVLSGRTVASVTITNGGSGYTSNPTVVFTGGGGTGAAATTTLAPTSVASLAVTAPGSGYTSAPTVSIIGGGGTGATAITSIGATTIASLSITAGGSGYTSTPGILFTGGGGTGAAASAVMASSGSVGSVTITDGLANGFGALPPTVSFLGGGGTGAAGTAVLTSTGGIRAQSILDSEKGYGYSSPPTVVFTGGGGTGAAGTATMGTTGVVRKTRITSGGSGYSTAPTVLFSGGAGTGAAGFANITSGAVTSITMTNLGSGYVVAPAISFSGGGGSGAAASSYLGQTVLESVTMSSFGSGYSSASTVSFTGGSPVVNTTPQSWVPYKSVASVTITNPGSGYTSAPTVQFSSGLGGTPTGTASLTQSVASATVTNPGAGYTSAPTISFLGGGGSGAAASAVLSPASVASITLTAGGSGFFSVPSVALSGGGGTGAAASATLSGSSIASATVTAPGSNYTSAPSVSFTGGGGSGATATSALGSTASVAGLTLTAAGSGYTSAPAVNFSGGSGTGAAATSTLSTTSISSVSVSAGGSGYTSLPAIQFFGGGGSGASAFPTLAPSSIFEIDVTNGGAGYTSIPTIAFSAGTASAVAAINVNTGEVVLISAKQRHEDGYDVFDYMWAEGVGVIEERIALREGGLRLESWTSFGMQAGTGVFTPAGIPVTIDQEFLDGVTKWTVTCMQNSAGGNPTSGTALSYFDFVPFTYPGRAKAFTVSFPAIQPGPSTYTAYAHDVFKSPPIEIQIEASVEVSYTTDSTALGTLANPLWNPTSWATMRAFWEGWNVTPRSSIQSLFGYMATGTAILFTASLLGNGYTDSCLGERVYGGSSGSITISGGPSDPAGSTWTLAAKLEPAFVDFYGVQYYRKTIVTATIPAQPALPV